MHQVSTAGLLLLVSLTTACNERSANDRARKVIGCYRLQPETDVTAADAALLRQRYTLFALLDARVGAKVSIDRPARLFGDSVRREKVTYLAAGWTVDSLTDSIHVSSGDLFTSLGFAIIRTATGWRGTATRGHDFGPPFEETIGHVRAETAPCSATLRRVGGPPG